MSSDEAQAGRTASARPAPRPDVAPAGPGWFGAVMGTSILATLTRAHGVPVLPGLFWALGWGLLIVLTLGFAARCVRRPAVFTASCTQMGQVTAWGMVSMGYLSVGSSTTAVLPGWNASLTGLAWSIDTVMWCIGTALGLIAAIGFTAKLMKGHSERPLPAWGLPIVAPMVTATTGAQLAPHLPTVGAAVFVGIVSAGSFFVALSMGVAVFAVAYAHAWRREPLPLAAAASSFIPLGIVGQSTAAAQSLAAAGSRYLRPDAADAAAGIAHGYGVVMIILGIPLFAWAAVTTYRGFARRMPFTPGWWATTFPVGTCCLGTHLLGWDAVSIALLVMLGAHWCIAAGGTASNLYRGLATAKPARP